MDGRRHRRPQLSDIIGRYRLDAGTTETIYRVRQRYIVEALVLLPLAHRVANLKDCFVAN
jgi:hypothetical protein